MRDWVRAGGTHERYARTDRRVTIITWHYVRDGAPADLHARSVTEFDHQLEHIAANFTPVTLDAVIAATQDGNTAPSGQCLPSDLRRWVS